MNVTVVVTLVPGLIASPSEIGLATMNGAAGAAALVIVRGRLPVLETVKVFDTAWPTVTWPKLRLIGLTVTWSVPATAVAVRVTVALPSGPVTAILDVSLVAAVGA